MPTNRISVVIVDDEAPARDIVAAYLKPFAQIDVAAQCANGFEALKVVQELKPDILFLDVQMPKITGIELMEVMDNPPVVVFTTAYDEFAIKAFELNAVDYLLKPFSQDRFAKALEKAMARVGQQAPATTYNLNVTGADDEKMLPRIVVKNGANIKVIPVGEVLFIEAQEDYVMVHTSGGRYLKDQTMAYYETHLPPDKFVRIHRSTIVNVDTIERLEAYDKETYLAIVPPAHKLKVSRAGYKRLKETLRF
jgi:two-component system, LytTR family, response regulator